jgi:hypothetical protein
MEGATPMNSFVQRHQKSVIGILSGFDRLWLRGTLRWLAHRDGMATYLQHVRVLLKDFKAYAMSLTRRVRKATERVAEEAGRPLIRLADSSQRKDHLARQIAQRDGISTGLVCILATQEPFYSYKVVGNRHTGQLELRLNRPRCLHYYHYHLHPELGLLHVRVPTWLPFTLHVWINGREWLARQMDRAGIGYRRNGNCFLDVQDVAGAQALLDQQLRVDWPALLDSLVPLVHPAPEEIFAGQPVQYYWSADQTEWASDVLFRSPESLARVYPWLIRNAMTTLSSRDVMRFLGRNVPAQGGVHGNFQGQIITDVKHRPEGVRIKHRLNRNSIKMYDKSGSVLRVETTIHDARDMKVYRVPEGRPDGPARWYPLRKGVCGLYRRAQVSQAANERYLETMASVQPGVSLQQLTEPLCRPVRWKRKRVRALRPFSPDDAALLEAVNHGEFLITGFRNRG